MRCALVLTVVMLAAPAVAFGQEPEFNAQCGDFACRIERVPAKWHLLSVGRDFDRLELAYESGGCRQGDVRATVRETASARLRGAGFSAAPRSSGLFGVGGCRG